jgi:ATP-dependent DNA ligase
MYAPLVRELPDGGQWTYEPKLDGYRCLAANRDDRAVPWSRRGNGFTHCFAEIARACANLAPDTLILETKRCPFANLPEPRRYRWDVGLIKAIGSIAKL